MFWGRAAAASRGLKKPPQGASNSSTNPLPLLPRRPPQIQFLDYVAGPLWERLAQAFPALQPCIAQMRFNRRCFQAIASGVAAGIPVPPFAPGAGPAAAEEERTAIAAIAAAAEAAAARPLPSMPPAGRVLGSTPEESSLPGTDGEEEDGSTAPPSPLPDSDPIAGLVVRTRRAGYGGGSGSSGSSGFGGRGGDGGRGGGAAFDPPRPASYSGAVNLALAQARAVALRVPRCSSDSGDAGTPMRAPLHDGMASPLGGARGSDGSGRAAGPDTGAGTGHAAPGPDC
jgi:hypothetical protein